MKKAVCLVLLLAVRGMACAEGSELVVKQAVEQLSNGHYSLVLPVLHRQAALGNVDAQYNLGVVYDRGLGVVRNMVLARQWYEKAAMQGYAMVQYNLGVTYYLIQDGKPDYVTAKALFDKAAAQGVPQAQNYLGIMYYLGAGGGAEA